MKPGTKLTNRGWRRNAFKTAAICECGAHGFVGLTRGAVTLFSPESMAEVEPYMWHMSRGGYVRRTNKLGSDIYMHRAVCALEGGVIDHINGDTLDNRDENLRACTQRENMGNLRRSLGRSAFKGVSISSGGVISAAIRDNGKSIGLGRFGSEIEAARAYDAAAIRIFGQFALTNEDLGMYQARFGKPFAFGGGVGVAIVTTGGAQ